MGQGELTNVGIRQHFLLGAELRQRYIEGKKLLQMRFNASEVYFRSTDVNRTLISAESQVLGLYPLGAGPLFAQETTAFPPISLHIQIFPNHTRKQAFQPLPIHTVPANTDFLLQPSAACARLHHSLHSLYSSPRFQQVCSSNPSLLLLIMNTANLTYSQAVERLPYVVDNWVCNREVGNRLPEGVTEGVMRNATRLFDRIFSMRVETEENRRLFASAFFLELADLLDKVRKGREKSKFRLYSAHDDTLAGLLSGLQAFNSALPPFASSLLFEVYRHQAGFYIDIIYNDVKLNLIGCPFPCPLPHFADFLRKRAYSDYRFRCLSTSEPSKIG